MTTRPKHYHYPVLSTDSSYIPTPGLILTAISPHLPQHPPEFHSPYGSTSNLADLSSIPDIEEEPSEEQTMKSILQSIQAGDAASVSV